MLNYQRVYHVFFISTAPLGRAPLRRFISAMLQLVPRYMLNFHCSSRKGETPIGFTPVAEGKWGFR